jgi:hypothetical protein
MSTKFAEVAYELDWELDHFEDFHLHDWKYDLAMEPFPGSKQAEIDEIALFPHPDPIIFIGCLDIVRCIDYPYTNNRWPVMSKRMYEALLSVGDFPHRILPIAAVDDSILNDADRYDAQGGLRDDITSRDYVAVQLTEHADVFDWEKSRYTPHERLPNWPKDVKEYVFKIPPGGLPPLFRLKNHCVRLFVSAEARAALKAAGVCGTEYLSLRGPQKGGIGYEIDVPIVIPDSVFGK